MTREEAINQLELLNEEVSIYSGAIDMAITALQAQDVDAVSRQAVMWMLTNLSYTQCRTQGEVEVIGLAKTMLIAMPSAKLNFDMTTKIDKAYDDGYQVGYLQAKHDWGDKDG